MKNKNKNKKYPIMIGIFAVLMILITIGALYVTEQSAIGDSDLSVIITHSGAWDDNRASSMIGNIVFLMLKNIYQIILLLVIVTIILKYVKVLTIVN